MTYAFPTLATRPVAEPKTVYTVASGDLRLATNLKTWAMQQQVEAEFAQAVNALGWQVKRAHGVDPETGHGFIDNQRRGMDIFASIPLDAPWSSSRPSGSTATTSSPACATTPARSSSSRTSRATSRASWACSTSPDP